MTNSSKNALLAAVKSDTSDEQSTEIKTETPIQEKPALDKKIVVEKTKNVSAQLPPKYLKQLRMIAAEDDTSIQLLIKEALELLFTKKAVKDFF